MFAMACGAGALIVILSTFNGFENLATSLQESFQPDITILPRKGKYFELSDTMLHTIQRLEDVTHISKTIEDKIYIKYGNKDALASIKGVDSFFFKTNSIGNYLVAGDTLLENDEYSFAILGMGIAQKLNINLNNQFEQLELFSPKFEMNGLSLGDNFDRAYITPGGIFSIYQEYDDKYILVPISFMQYMKSVNENQITALEIKLKNNNSSKREIQKIVGADFEVKTKLELNETFYRISQIEKMITFFILVFVLVILSFNFIGSLSMHIIEKENDIRTLYYMGCTRKSIFRLYLLYGTLQGMFGGIIGLIAGLALCIIQHFLGLVSLPGNGTFVVQAYPVTIHFSDIIYIFIVLFLVSSVASIFPAHKAMKTIELS